MASDLDRPYVINGDDLRIALSGTNWTVSAQGTDGCGGTFGPLKYPEEVARTVLEDAARPYEARTADAQALARALKDRVLCIRNAVPGLLDGTVVGKVVAPEALAETLLEEMDGKPHPMPAQCRHDGPDCACQLPAPPDRDGGLTGIPDREIDAIAAIGDALAGLDAHAQRDILAYWTARADREIAAAGPF
jgi:hypothetical protein